jgi:hypothetical protein
VGTKRITVPSMNSFLSSAAASSSNNGPSKIPRYASSNPNNNNNNHSQLHHHRQSRRQSHPFLGDAEIARELNRLSIQEREEVLYEVHGVAELKNETPESIQTALIQMRTEIATYCDKNKKHHHRRKDLSTAAYERVIANCYSPSLVLPSSAFADRDDFLVPFLRADRFDAKAAAERFLLYFDLKERIFGSRILHKEHVLLPDMDDDSILCLQSGGAQILPGRDLGGRPILVGFGKLRNIKSERVLVRL